MKAAFLLCQMESFQGRRQEPLSGQMGEQRELADGKTYSAGCSSDSQTGRLLKSKVD